MYADSQCDTQYDSVATLTSIKTNFRSSLRQKNTYTIVYCAYAAYLSTFHWACRAFMPCNMTQITGIG